MTKLRIALGSALAALGAALTVASAGCAPLSQSLDGTPPPGDAGAQTSCPNDFHAECPTPAPSYKTDIAPIVSEHCLLCHKAGGYEPTENSFTSYQAIYDDRQAVEDQINDCRMPPIDAGIALPTASRVLLLTWLACGAPDN